MALSRDEKQFILDVLAELCGRKLGVELKYTLKEPEQEKPEERPKEA